MAAKKPKKAEKPEKVIGAVKAGKLEIDTAKLAAFSKELKDMGILYPKVKFVARNAPFMRQPPI